MTQCTSATPPPKPIEPPKPPPRADLVLFGGAVETLSGVKGATAVAVKDGRIVDVGSDDALRPWIGGATRVVDLAGRTVVPGLVDSHMHLQGLGMRRVGVDLVGCASVDEVRARVKAAVKNAKPGEWILGRGWDQNDWEAYRKKGIKFPSTKELDDLAPRNPVVLTRIDGHALWVNTKALEAAGITAKTKVKAGGEILKAKDGKPTGILIDNAMVLVEEKVPAPTKAQIKEALVRADEECLAAGLTQVHDMGVGPATLEVLKELDAAGDLGVRVYAFLEGSVEDLGALMGAGPIVAKGSERLTVRGVKFFADGALGSRGALLHKPYSDDKKTSGIAVTPPEVLEARARTAAERGFQVATHAIGDKANTTVLDIYARVFGPKAKDARPRIEHAQVIVPEDIPRFAKEGVIASMQPTHATSDMPWAEQRLGKERLMGAYAWRSLLTSGSTIAAGSDAPVEDVSPVLGLYAAVSRKDMFGSPEGGWIPGEKMTPVQALGAFTAGGAFASFRENEAGRIEKGFVADLTVLEKDPLTATEEELSGLQVALTIVGGKIEYARPGADAAPGTAGGSTSGASGGKTGSTSGAEKASTEVKPALEATPKTATSTTHE